MRNSSRSSSSRIQLQQEQEQCVRSFCFSQFLASMYRTLRGEREEGREEETVIN